MTKRHTQRQLQTQSKPAAKNPFACLCDDEDDETERPSTKKPTKPTKTRSPPIVIVRVAPWAKNVPERKGWEWADSSDEEDDD